MQVEAFIGEIRIFAGRFAPVGWALCEGQVLAISGNEALYSLIGTTYGGDGRSTFALPDYRGRIAVGQGSGPGVRPRTLGQQFGTQKVTLTVEQIPAHSHPMMGSSAPASRESPLDAVLATVDGTFYEAAGTADRLVDFPSAAVGESGQGQTIDTRMSSLVINYMIAIQGEYPQRT